MTKAIYDLSEEELFRLTSAYTAIRTEFLRTIEAWATDQWCIPEKE